MESQIACPKCGHKFELTGALAGPLVAAAVEKARKDAEALAVTQMAEFAERALDDAKAQAAGVIEEERHRNASLVRQVESAGAALAANERKLAEAQAAQAEALRKGRELDDARRELELTVEKRTADGLAEARRQAELAADGRAAQKLAEREETIASMQRTVEELRRKAEQGSQQLQGEVQELALETALRTAFPADSIEPVGKGVQGGDCLQVVAGGQGRILWESKVTKAWSPGWLAKLRDDARAASAELMVIVSTALPKGMEGEFNLVEGVWVCAPRHAVSLAAALRQGVVEAAQARAAGQGLETKAGLTYGYLTGPKFKSRVSAIVEAFTTMREDLEAERRSIQKQWAKREAQIERVLQGTVGMYGDLQAVAGRSLSEVEGLELLS